MSSIKQFGGFFSIIQTTVIALDRYKTSINLYRRFSRIRYRLKMEKIASKLVKQRIIDGNLLNEFMGFIEMNRDIFPEEYFEVNTTQTGERCLSFYLERYDKYKYPFTYYFHNKDFKIILNEDSGKIVVRVNIHGDNTYSTKRYNNYTIIANDTDNSFVVESLLNIMYLCTMCFLRGDYYAIESCFRIKQVQ